MDQLLSLDWLNLDVEQLRGLAIALGVLIIGWLVARVIGGLVCRVVRTLHVDRRLEAIVGDLGFSIAPLEGDVAQTSGGGCAPRGVDHLA